VEGGEPAEGEAAADRNVEMGRRRKSGLKPWRGEPNIGEGPLAAVWSGGFGILRFCDF